MPERDSLDELHELLDILLDIQTKAEARAKEIIAERGGGNGRKRK